MLSVSAAHSLERSRLTDAEVAKCWCCRRSTFRLSVFVSFLVGYLAIGAVCFMWIETPYELREKEHLREHRARFLYRHSCVSDKALEEFLMVIRRATDLGIPITRNASHDQHTWTFGQSLFFASTVVTTVGYGHVAPLSEGGKLFCVFFAMVGIPLTLILFTAVIERLSLPAEKLFFFLRVRIPNAVSDFHVKVIHLIIFVFIHIVIITLVPAAIFAYLEKDWNFLDSVYFCFITWTTIGLGDFVPGEKTYQPLRQLYKIIASLYMFISLISMLFVLKTFHDTPHLNLGARVYMESDLRPDEQLPLQPGDGGPKYTRQLDENSSTAEGMIDVNNRGAINEGGSTSRFTPPPNRPVNKKANQTHPKLSTSPVTYEERKDDDDDDKPTKEVTDR